MKKSGLLQIIISYQIMQILHLAIEDGLDRLLLPSIEREIRADKKRRADEAAIKVFGENLKNLLLTPPIK
jgi:uncharacterized protein